METANLFNISEKFKSEIDPQLFAGTALYIPSLGNVMFCGGYAGGGVLEVSDTYSTQAFNVTDYGWHKCEYCGAKVNATHDHERLVLDCPQCGAPL